jgi:hypothetical protein
VIQIYQEIAALGGRQLAEALANLPILIKVGEITRDGALRLLDHYLKAGPYDPIEDPEAVRTRLADSDWQQWYSFRNGPDSKKRRVRSLVYDAINAGEEPR